MKSTAFLKSKIKSIRTYGESMWPLLQDGDIVYINKTKWYEIKINDIVCVIKNRKMFTHRVVYKASNFLITKGDNNQIDDGKIYSKNFIGVVNKVKRESTTFNIKDLYLIQSTLYFEEIKKVKKTFLESKIKIIFLKGLPLHLYFEGQYPNRLYADCDILLQEKDIPKAKILLNKLGYNIADYPSSKLHKKFKTKKSEMSFIKIINGVPIIFDVHRELVFLMTRLSGLDSLYSDMLVRKFTDSAVRNTQTILVQREKFEILSKEYLVVYLALHIYHHNFKGSYRFEFLEKIIRKSNLDYSLMREIILKFKLGNFTYPSFMILKKIYRTNISDDFLLSVSPSKKTRVFMEHNIFNTNIFSDDFFENSSRIRFKNLFNLSPNPVYRRLLVFLNLEVVHFIFWDIRNRVKSQF